MSAGVAALSFVTTYGTSLSAAVLSTKVLAFLTAIAPYLIIVFAVVLAAVLVYYAAKAKSKGKTKIPDKLKSGGKIKTPQSHKGEFTKKRGDLIHIIKQGGDLRNLKTDITMVNTGMHPHQMVRQGIIIILVPMEES